MTPLTFLFVLTLRVTIVLSGAALLTVVLRRASAACRHLVWSCALAGILIMPAAMLIGPHWALPILPANTASAVPVAAAHPGSIGRAVFTTTGTAPTDMADASAALPPAAALALRVSDVLDTPSALSTGTVVLGAWLLGLVAFAGWLMLGVLRLGRLARQATPVLDADWHRELDAARRRLSLPRRVKLLSGVGTPVPLTWGTLQPVVLVPDDAEGWTPDRRRVVLLHELAHIRRWDCFTQRLGRVVCAIHWFNPLVWLAARQLGREREQACDELVIACGTRASDYAEQLLSFARPKGAAGWPAAIAMPMARSSQLETRLRMILNPRVPRPPRGAAVRLSLLLTLGAIVLAIATAQPVASAAAQDTVSAQHRPTATRVGTEYAPAAEPAASPAPQPATKPAPQPEMSGGEAVAAGDPPATPSTAPAPSTAPTPSTSPAASRQDESRHRNAHRHQDMDRDRQEQRDRAMQKLSRTLQRKLDRLQPLLDNLHVHVDIRDEHGRPVDPHAIAQAVQDALEGTDLVRLAREAAAEASVDMADTITDAVTGALQALPESLDHLRVCLDEATACSPRKRKH